MAFVPPIPIDAGNLPFISPMGATSVALDPHAQRDQFNGPFSLSGAFWVVAALNTDSKINVYKSSDLGASWTIQDQANSIATTSGLGSCFAVRSSGVLLYVLYQHPSGSVGNSTGLRVRTFDTSTGLWGADSLDCPNTDGGHCLTFDLAVAASQINVVFSLDTGICGTTPLIGGVWGSETDFGTEFTTPIITGVTLDSSDQTIHVFYSQVQSFGGSPLAPNVVRHLTISPLGAVSGPDVAIADAVQHMTSNFTYPSFSSGVVLASGKIFAPFTLRLGTGVDQKVPAVLVGSGSSWNVVALSTTLLDAQQQTGAFTFAAFISPKVYLIWQNNVTAEPGDVNVRQVRYVTTTDGVTFSPIVTAWDMSVNPASGVPLDLTDVDMAYLSAAPMPTGDMGVFLDISDSTDGDLGRYFFSFGAAPVPPVVKEHIPFMEFRGIKRMPERCA